MGFPVRLTEEESVLQRKFNILKKKKKQLLLLKNRSKIEAAKAATTKVKPDEKRKNLEDAMEEAKKLVITGAIKTIKKPAKSCGFKRARPLKSTDSEKPALSTTTKFESFEESQMGQREKGSDSGQGLDLEDKSHQHNKTDLKKQYKTSFVSAGIHGSARSEKRPTHGHIDDQEEEKPSETIYMRGTQLNDEFVREICSKYGTVKNINVIPKEPGMHQAFITFDSIRTAEKAKLDLHRKQINDEMELSVYWAKPRKTRKDFNKKRAAVPTEKRASFETRELVRYDDAEGLHSTDD